MRNTSGAAAAEMALMLPMLITLMFGGMEGAYFFWAEHRVVKAVRDGARYAGRQSVDQYTCTGGGSIVQATKDRILKLTRTGTLDGTGTPLLPNWGDTATSDTTVSVTGCDTTSKGLFGDGVTGPVRVTVTVSADVPYTSLFILLGFPAGTLRLRASEQAVVMGL
ncbi:pilus assembly protein TadE [Novosphingobium sp. Gsoil 351]|nr:pilus assembly protein TadE [Novosphingobium sp. Gsoil 351]